MDETAALARWRAGYAQLVAAAAGVDEPRLIAAFARVRREDFLGPGPWLLSTGGRYLRSPDADPRWVNQDLLVALLCAQRINNGQPSLHCRAIAALAPRDGDQLVHIGCGSGYYSALLAELIGPRGQLRAIERNGELAARARRHLQAWPNVQVLAGDDAEHPLPPCDGLYVSAGAGAPPLRWLRALRPGGRLLFPWTLDDGWGWMINLCRLDAHRFDISALQRVGFIDCAGTRDAATARALEALWRRGRPRGTLHLGAAPPRGAALVGAGWWLAH